VRQLHVEHLERLRGVDTKANDEIPTAQTALADSRRRLAERRSDEMRLTLSAPSDGVIIPAPRKTETGPTSTKLPGWHGSLLDPKSLGANVEPGTLVCLVGDPKKLTAVLLVDDADIKRVEPGQKVLLRIDELPGQILHGEVTEISRHKVDDAGHTALGQADLSPLLAGLVAPGHEAPRYETRVKFDLPAGVTSENVGLIIGGRGEAKVNAERITVGRRILRYLAQTFRLPM
jgi:hypothetical protein